VEYTCQVLKSDTNKISKKNNFHAYKLIIISYDFPLLISLDILAQSFYTYFNLIFKVILREEQNQPCASTVNLLQSKAPLRLISKLHVNQMKNPKNAIQAFRSFKFN